MKFSGLEHLRMLLKAVQVVFVCLLITGVCLTLMGWFIAETHGQYLIKQEIMMKEYREGF